MPNQQLLTTFIVKCSDSKCSHSQKISIFTEPFVPQTRGGYVIQSSTPNFETSSSSSPGPSQLQPNRETIWHPYSRPTSVASSGYLGPVFCDEASLPDNDNEPYVCTSRLSCSHCSYLKKQARQTKFPLFPCTYCQGNHHPYLCHQYPTQSGRDKRATLLHLCKWCLQTPCNPSRHTPCRQCKDSTSQSNNHNSSLCPYITPKF